MTHQKLVQTRIACLFSFSILVAPSLSGAPFTVQLVKSDKPGELVHVLDADTAKWQEEGNEGFPAADVSDFDMTLGRRPGCRVTTWLKHFSVDGERIFQKRYKGKFLFREASTKVEIEDGRHVLNPGEHAVVVENGKASSPDPDVMIRGSTISVVCYPVRFAALNMAVDSSEPVVERTTSLPGKRFNVQVHNKEGYKYKKLKPDEEPGPTWDDLLEVHLDFQPLTVYLPANTLGRAYRVMPTKDEFILASGQVQFRPSTEAEDSAAGAEPHQVGQPLPSGVEVVGGLSVWIPQYTSRAVFRCKSSNPLFVSLTGIFTQKCCRGGAPSDTFENSLYYHHFYEPKARAYNAGLMGKKPGEGLEIPCDPVAFPHRLLVADNRSPLSDDARLLAVFLDKNICRLGDHIRARVQFRDLPKPETFAGGEVRAFLRPEAQRVADWTPTTVEKTDTPDQYHLKFPDSVSGVCTLRVVVDRPGQGSAASDIYADFQVGVQQAGITNTVALFTHYNRESFYEGEGIELVAVVKNETPVSGTLAIDLVGDESKALREVIRKPVTDLPPGRHTFHLFLPPAATTPLRPETYRLVVALEGCEAYAKKIRIVTRKRRSSMVIAYQPSWEGAPCGALKNTEALDFAMEHMREIGFNQLIEAPGGYRRGVVPIQDRAFATDISGTPASEFLYEPTMTEALLDRTLAAGMDLWFWKPRLVGNLRWGPLEDLDVDRFAMQFCAKLGTWYPHLKGLDMGWWEALEYVDMGGRPGSYPEQERMREQELLPKRFEETYGEKCPTLAELKEYTETLEDKNHIHERWRKLYALKCSLMPEVFTQYTEAVHRIKPHWETTWTEQEVMVNAPFAALVPEVAYKDFPLSRWQSTHENGSRPLNTALMTALGKFDDKTRCSTIYSMNHFHIPHVRRTYFRLWQRMLMALACGADEVGYQEAQVYSPMQSTDIVANQGFVTPNHVLERVALKSLNRSIEMYSGVFENVERERDLAILHSMTQLGFEHAYYGAEWHNNDLFCRYVTEPFCRGAHFLRVESAFSGFLWSHLPADIIGEIAIKTGRLSKYKGLAITGIELPSLPGDVTQAIRSFIAKGGVVLMDHHCKPDIPGAVKLDFGFDFIRTGWSNDSEYRGMQHEYGRVKDKLDAVLKSKFKRAIDCDSDTVLLSSSKWGDSRFLTVACDRIVKDLSFVAMYEREPLQTTVTVSGAAPVVYDLFEFRKVKVTPDGKGANRFVADLTRVGAKLFAILPADIGAPELQVSSAVSTGEGLIVSAALKSADGQPVNILTPIEVTVSEPDGRERYRVYRAIKGRAAFKEEFKIAENDPTGEWRVVLRELFSGRAAQATFEVQARDPQPAPSTALPEVVVYGADGVREFCSTVKQAIVPFDREDAAPSTTKEASTAPMAEVRERLTALGIQSEAKRVDDFAVLRRNLPRKVSNRGEKQIGPKYIFKGHVVIPDIAGQSSLLKSMVNMAILPVRVTRNFPGPGRGLLLRVVSPFYFGYDALVISGGDEAGFRKALAALSEPGQLRDIGTAGADRQLTASSAPLKSAVTFQPSDVDLFPKVMADGVDGMPVMQLDVSPDGSHILAATENYMKNVFMLDASGKILWSGKGAQKWPAECRITRDRGALVVDAKRAIYELDATGRTVSRLSGVNSGSLAAEGESFMAATRDWTGVFKRDGSTVWLLDYFPTRQSFPALRGAWPRDDLIAISPDGSNGIMLDWTTKGEDEKGNALPARRMRQVEVRSGKIVATHVFEPHESSYEHGMRQENMWIRFSQNGQMFTVANRTGHLFLFRTHRLQRVGSHFEAGLILAKPFEKLYASPENAPDVWRSRTPAQFVDLKPDGSYVLAGFANRKVVILDGRAQVVQTRTYDAPVVCGVFLASGSAVFAGGELHLYDGAGKELWRKRLPFIYRMKSTPDGKAMICGTSGGHVMKVDLAGSIIWRTDLHPASLGEVDALFRDLASAEELPCGPTGKPKSELETIRANVPFGGNLLADAVTKRAWTGKGWTLAPAGGAGPASLLLGHAATAEQKVTERLQPFSTYFLIVPWQPHHVDDELTLSASIEDEGGEQIDTERPFTVTARDRMESGLPIKTGPKPLSVTVRLTAKTRGTLRAFSPELRRAEFGSENAALIPQAFHGYTKESRAAARKRLTVMFRHLAGNLEESVLVEPLEMLNGRITRKEGSEWSAGDIAQMGGVEVSFREPKTIGSIAFYDDAAHPESYLKQYTLEYWEQSDTPQDKKPEDVAEEKVDEIDFIDVWKGQWKTAFVERNARGPAHIHRLAKPLTSTRFRISGLLNQVKFETRITELELYELNWPTLGGAPRRTHYSPNAGIQGDLVVVKQGLLASRRFTQSTPTFAGGDLYASSGGKLYAVDLGNYTTRWEFDAGRHTTIQSSPTVAGNLVLFGCHDYSLRAVDRKSGELVWSMPTDYMITGSPCVVGKNVYFGSGDGFVYAVNHENGELLWEFEAGQPIRSSVASDGEAVYFSSFDNHVHALDIRKGAKKWSHKTSAPIRSGVAVTDQAVFVGSDDGNVYAIDKTTGKLLWKQTTRGFVEASPALDEASVYLGSVDGIFRCFDQKTGTLRWQLDAQSPIRSAAVVLGPQVIFYSDSNILRMLDKETGKELSQLTPTGVHVLTDITPIGNMLAIGTRQGYIFLAGGVQPKKK